MTKWAEYFKVAQLLIMQHLELTLGKKIILIKITGLFCLREIHDLLGKFENIHFVYQILPKSYLHQSVGNVMRN